MATDEDNGLAVVTRQMIDDYELFQTKGLISYSGNVKIQDSDPDAITSVLGLFQIVKALYPRKHRTWPRLTAVQRSRPNADVLRQIFDYSTGYWQTLIENIPEYKAVFVNKTKMVQRIPQADEEPFAVPSGGTACLRPRRSVRNDAR